jgi:hypothetical protein
MSTATPSIWDQAEQESPTASGGSVWDQAAQNPTASARTQLENVGALPKSHPSHVLDDFNKETGQNETPEEHNKYLGTAVGTGFAVGTMGVPLAEGIAANGLRAGLINAGKPIAKSIIGGLGGHYLGREAGGLVGHPDIGGQVGGLVGGLYGAGGGKIPTKESLIRLFNDEAPEIASPGAPLPSADEFYANRGKEIATAMRQQPEAFAEPSPVANPGAPLPSAEKFYEQRGADITRAMRQQPEAFASPGAPAVGGGAKPTPDVIRIPAPREPLPGENPGYTASTPRRLLVGNALQGRPGAGDMLRNTGKTVIYTAPEGYPGPRAEVAPPGELHGNATPFGGPVAAPSPAEEFLRSVSSGNEPEVEHVASPSGPRGNASGVAGGGGLEEQGRMESENAQGVKYFRENPGGGRSPLTGLGRQDLKAGPGQRIIRVDANGGETVLDAQPLRAPSTRPVRKPPQ